MPNEIQFRHFEGVNYWSRRLTIWYQYVKILTLLTEIYLAVPRTEPIKDHCELSPRLHAWLSVSAKAGKTYLLNKKNLHIFNQGFNGSIEGSANAKLQLRNT
jgi:hypothetical protein